MKKTILGSALVAALATTLTPAPAHAAAHDLKIKKVTTTTLDSGTCALKIRFKDKSPKSLDGNDFYSLSITPSVDYDGQWSSTSFTVYPCDAFKKGHQYKLQVQECDDNGTRQKVVAKSPIFKWRAVG